jgi:solute carrier family 25 iron transporter 28/37
MQIINPTPSAVYNGMIQGGYRIATGEGFLSLWRGMSSVVVGAGVFLLGVASLEKSKC